MLERSVKVLVPLLVGAVLFFFILDRSRSAGSKKTRPAPNPQAQTAQAGYCGPKALATVVRYYRIQVSWDSVARVAQTGPEGTTMLGLAKTAKVLGFEAVGLQTDYEGLAKLPVPSLVYLNNQHFATLLWCQEDSVLIEDGGEKSFLNREAFLKAWGGFALALYPNKKLQQRLMAYREDNPRLDGIVDKTPNDVQRNKTAGNALFPHSPPQEQNAQPK
jgi:predicted double-glycine peptidase